MFMVIEVKGIELLTDNKEVQNLMEYKQPQNIVIKKLEIL